MKPSFSCSGLGGSDRRSSGWDKRFAPLIVLVLAAGVGFIGSTLPPAAQSGSATFGAVSGQAGEQDPTATVQATGTAEPSAALFTATRPTAIPWTAIPWEEGTPAYLPHAFQFESPQQHTPEPTATTGLHTPGPTPTEVERCPPPVSRCQRCPGCTPTVVDHNTPTVCPICRP